MPANKQAQINGFSLFVRQRVKPYLDRQRGRNVSMPECIDAARDLWVNVSAEEKEEWKQQAKVYKKTDDWHEEKKVHRDRYLRERERQPATSGRASKPKEKRRPPGLEAELDDRRVFMYYDETDMQVFARKRERDRRDLMDDFQWHAPTGCLTNNSNQSAKDRNEYIKSRSFHLLTVTPYFEEPTTHEFIPAELALVEFSLADGVKSTDCIILGHGLDDFPTDEAYYDALRRSEQHRIGIDGAAQQSLVTDYAGIVRGIKESCDGEKFIFVYSKEYNAVQGSLNWLMNQAIANSGSAHEIKEDRIACIEDLIATYALWQKLQANWDEINENCDPEKWNAYDLAEGSLCAYHEELQCRHCAQAVAKKLLYFMFDHISQNMIDYELDEHIPQSKGTVNYDDDLAAPVAAAAAAAAAGEASPAARSASGASDEYFSDELEEELGKLDCGFGSVAQQSLMPPAAFGRGRGLLVWPPPPAGTADLGRLRDRPANSSADANRQPAQIGMPLAPPLADAPVAQRASVDLDWNRLSCALRAALRARDFSAGFCCERRAHASVEVDGQSTTGCHCALECLPRSRLERCGRVRRSGSGSSTEDSAFAKRLSGRRDASVDLAPSVQGEATTETAPRQRLVDVATPSFLPGASNVMAADTPSLMDLGSRELDELIRGERPANTPPPSHMRGLGRGLPIRR